MAQYDLNVRDYWRVLRRRKGVVVVVALAFGATAYIFAEMQKPKPIYQAIAVVKFERMTTLVGLLVETISVSSGDNLATQAAVVRSFPVLERAAKTLQLIPPDLDSDAIKRNSQYIQILSDLRGQVVAAPEENTNLIDITVTSPEAARATRIVNAVAQAYREENVLTRNRQIREAHRFIQEQLADVGGRLQAAEDGILALKQRRSFVSLAEETTTSLARLNTLQNEYEKVRQVQQETVSQIQALQAPQVVSGSVPPRIFTDAGDPTIAKLNTSLLDLGVERENLLTTLTPQHPQIHELNTRIATTRVNLVRELRLKIQTFEGRVADLQRQIQLLQQEQRTLPDVARQYAQLQRDLTINETLFSQLRSKLQEVQIKEKEQVEEVSLVRPATEPTRPINSPETFGKGLVGLLIGLIIGLVLAFVRESMDTSIGTIQDVEGFLGIPVLGLIPNIDPTKDPALAHPEDEEADSILSKMWPFLICLLSPKSTISEAYRSLRTNVDFLSLEKHVKTLCITSASLMEGKTTTAINLAISVVQMGKKVLLVEADLRHPFVHHAFGIPRDPGLAEVILGNTDWRECLRTVTDLMLGPLGLEKLMAAPNLDKLSILTSGSPPPNPAEFLSSQRMTDLVAEFRRDFDLVIFDCSPILPVTDAAILSSKMDGTLIVYRVGRTPRTALKRAKALLDSVRGKILGIVLTGVRAEVSPDYEELEYYRYAYGKDPGQRMAERLASQRDESLFRRMAGPLTSSSFRIKAILLVGVLLLLVAALAAWFGIFPTGWVRNLAPGFDKTGTVSQVLHGEGRMARAPTPGMEEASAAPVKSTPASPQATAEESSGASPVAVSPPVEPQPQEAPDSSPPPRPFSLQVDSWTRRAVSMARAAILRKAGLDAFTVPAEIPGRGLWYRVVIGGFDSTSTAIESGEELRVKGLIREALVLSLPYAVEAKLATAHRPAGVVAVARRSGYLPSLHPDGGDPSAGSTQILRIDAFPTDEQANHMADILRAAGFSPRVIRR